MSDVSVTEMPLADPASLARAVHPAPDAATATDRASWFARLEDITEESGYFQTVGTRHWALFIDESPTLLVSFESIDQARARPGQMPLAHGIAHTRGWSHLCVISDGETWYRDPAVYAYFDRLVDDAFFEDFDRVVFYGAGPAGYAAAAFAVTAPGSTVLALNPLATLAPAQAGWDKRYASARRFDFTSRYGYAPDMVDGTAKMHVIHDPMVPEMAMHAALFRASHAVPLRARHIGDRLEWALIHMGVLDGLIVAAAEDRLTQTVFAKAWRKRREFAPYLRSLLDMAAAAGRPGHEAMICRSVTRRLRAPRFRRRLAELMAQQGQDTAEKPPVQ